MYKHEPGNLIAVGNHLSDSVLEDWIQKTFVDEELTGLNGHVRYVHTKYMLVDPLSDDPIVVTGSANFSNASTKNNDENMLIIRGDTRVADIYLGEFMRLYTHYRFRAFAQEAAEVSVRAVVQRGGDGVAEHGHAGIAVLKTAAGSEAQRSLVPRDRERIIRRRESFPEISFAHHKAITEEPGNTFDRQAFLVILPILIL